MSPGCVTLWWSFWSESQSQKCLWKVSAVPCLKWQSRAWSTQLKSFYILFFHSIDPVSSYNPLHVAVLRNRPNMVKLLVGHGADIEKRDRIRESSALDLASEESERLPCLLTLLDLGAAVNARDKHGKTPLLHALANSRGLTEHNTGNIELLLERGTDFKMSFVFTLHSCLLLVIQIFP
uniref:Uncharacterized protein n=1 Tax=Amphiprion percula TaxID=161767 RepID=A0A3P8SM87_AMPPE